MQRELIITCDDCGLSEGINQAAISLHKMGMATAPSILTNFPATQHAFKLFSQYPALRCGVHLNLNEGYPVEKITSPSPLTCMDGQFRSRRSVLLQALRPSAEFLRLAENELSAQIERYLTSGLSAYHLTTHSHFHVVPALRNVVMRLAEKFQVEWVRQHRLSATVLPVNPFFAREHAAAETPNQPDYLTPIIFWTERPPALLAKRIDALRGRIEIVVHPSTPHDATFPIDGSYSPIRRYKEMQYLEDFLRLRNWRV